MNIGLLDCDRKTHGLKFPNLALMKISAYHKSIGNSIGWVENAADVNVFDKIYASKIFTFKPDPTQSLMFLNFKGEIIKGGTGFNIKGKLPHEIESQFPDYSIYPQVDYAVGFLTRGCINNCPWCCVPEKEGKLKHYNNWQEIKRANSNKLVLMDNNILAHPMAIDIINEMAAAKLKVDFNQGLDARLFTENHATAFAALNVQVMTPASSRWRKGIRFSCDSKAQIPHIKKCILHLSKVGYKPRDIYIYCLLTDDYADSVARVSALRDMGVCVNAQPYRDLHKENEIPKWQKQMSTWTFKRSEFFATSWGDYWKNKEAHHGTN